MSGAAPWGGLEWTRILRIFIFMQGENNRGGGGWKWFDITIIGGWNYRGGGLLGEIENSRFLR